jgi:DNA-directed RNA polymerase subunit M/transcription elongation factor TFIIS
LRPIRKDGESYLVCKRCGFSKPLNRRASTYSSKRIIEEARHGKIGVIEDRAELRKKLREEEKELEEEKRRELMDLLNREQEEAEAEEE